jgi:hypothetical protein
MESTPIASMPNVGEIAARLIWPHGYDPAAVEAARRIAVRHLFAGASHDFVVAAAMADADRQDVVGAREAIGTIDIRAYTPDAPTRKRILLSQQHKPTGE